MTAKKNNTNETIRNESLVESIIASINQDLAPQQSFINLYLASIRKLRRLVKRWGLKSVVSNEQIQDTAVAFMNDMSSSPDENQFFAKLLAICKLRPPHHHKSIEYYASRRLFTLLKYYASESSKDYLKFNESVKRALRKHHQRKVLRKIPPEFWTGNFSKNTAAGNVDTFSTYVLARLPLRKKSDSSGRFKCCKLSESLQQLLKHELHIPYKFKRRNISATLYNLLPTPVLNSPALFTQSEEDSGLVCSSIIESFLAQLPSKKLIRKQILMAGLAFFATRQPELFTRDILLAQHQKLFFSKAGEVDIVHQFLNDEKLGNVLNCAIARSTAANRINSFRLSLQAALSDCPAIIQQRVISRLVSMLINQYKKVLGRI